MEIQKQVQEEKEQNHNIQQPVIIDIIIFSNIVSRLKWSINLSTVLSPEDLMGADRELFSLSDELNGMTNGTSTNVDIISGCRNFCLIKPIKTGKCPRKHPFHPLSLSYTHNDGNITFCWFSDGTCIKVVWAYGVSTSHVGWLLLELKSFSMAFSYPGPR